MITQVLNFKQVDDLRVATIFFNYTGAYIVDYGGVFNLTVISGTEMDWDILPGRMFRGISRTEVNKILLELRNLN